MFVRTRPQNAAPPGGSVAGKGIPRENIAFRKQNGRAEILKIDRFQISDKTIDQIASSRRTTQLLQQI